MPEKNGKNTENKILKFRLLSVFCPSFLFLKFDIKNGLRFWKTEKIRKKNGNIKKNGKKTEKRRKFGKTDPSISVFWNFRFFSGIFPAIFRFFSVFQNAIRFYFFLKYGQKTEKKRKFWKTQIAGSGFFSVSLRFVSGFLDVIRFLSGTFLLGQVLLWMNAINGVL